ncbi:replication protein [Priestia aryabhattai]|uniref:poly-gamma-glutamate hydrolase family protein n=1 Tax=Bacillaceae TaxID=186817 RepID=UPI000BA1302C|nr:MULTISPECIES: poly-gamma-glutamate hydrolase family protein [Bacillaceae]MDT2046248.1 poly-gamma-glutamate hydrolase family protein [Priestia flexa]OZT10724.1 replication protein [Priestia aryabhattai]TDB50063.1 replication protein [Bacillus sp. CBEL-1]USY53729.1 poly-gamma-glutamate hydrolase family protein [Bacillus sp. 1780r2a1]
MRDVYQTFQELSQCERAGIDYEIECIIRKKDIVVLAIHGGTMEEGTLEIARELAQEVKGTFYAFKCLKEEDPFELHVTSTHYDEELARSLVNQSDITISFHGARGTKREIYIGGRDESLASRVEEFLTPQFIVSEPPAHLRGVSPDNIANDNTRHQGLQLELTVPQYDELLTNVEKKHSFLESLVKAIKESE